jgi:hypothetical protein
MYAFPVSNQSTDFLNSRLMARESLGPDPFQAANAKPSVLIGILNRRRCVENWFFGDLRGYHLFEKTASSLLDSFASLGYGKGQVPHLNDQDSS